MEQSRPTYVPHYTKIRRHRRRNCVPRWPPSTRIAVMTFRLAKLNKRRLMESIPTPEFLPALAPHSGQRRSAALPHKGLITPTGNSPSHADRLSVPRPARNEDITQRARAKILGRNQFQRFCRSCNARGPMFPSWSVNWSAMRTPRKDARRIGRPEMFVECAKKGLRTANRQVKCDNCQNQCPLSTCPRLKPHSVTNMNQCPAWEYCARISCVLLHTHPMRHSKINNG